MHTNISAIRLAWYVIYTITRRDARAVGGASRVSLTLDSPHLGRAVIRYEDALLERAMRINYGLCAWFVVICGRQITTGPAGIGGWVAHTETAVA